MTTTNSSLHDAPQISAKPAPGEKERCVLAYSGGLDTSVCIKWLQEEYDLDVIAVVGDLGQEHEGLEAIKAKALATGAIGCAVIDMRETFANEYLACAMAANAMYENKYPLVSALSRPLIAKHLVAVAHQFGAALGQGLVQAHLQHGHAAAEAYGLARQLLVHLGLLQQVHHLHVGEGQRAEDVHNLLPGQIQQL